MIDQEQHKPMQADLGYESLSSRWVTLGTRKTFFFGLTDLYCSFFPLFSNYIYQLCNDIESIQQSTNSVLQDFKDDGVAYLELRTTPRDIPFRGITKNDYVAIILQCIEDFGRDKMSTYLILSVDRRHTQAEAEEIVDLAVKYRARGVVGIDLCGDPSRGNVSMFREPFAKARDYGLKLTLHFAEVQASSTEKELATLLSYEPERLGHVICVPDAVKQEIISRRLGLELCLSCNVLAKLTAGGIPDHHFGYWKDKGCPVTFCVSMLIPQRFNRSDNLSRQMTLGFLVVRHLTSTC